MSLSERLQELKSSRAIIIKQRVPARLKMEQSLLRLIEKYDQIGPTRAKTQ